MSAQSKVYICAACVAVAWIVLPTLRFFYGASLVFGQFFAGEPETQPLPTHSEAMTA